LATATAQPPPSPLEVGPAVGEVAPRFEARDQTGRLRTFEDLRGPSGLVLLFFRSADW
jgi:peroxiredoxin